MFISLKLLYFFPFEVSLFQFEWNSGRVFSTFVTMAVGCIKYPKFAKIFFQSNLCDFLFESFWIFSMVWILKVLLLISMDFFGFFSVLVYSTVSQLNGL